MKMLKQKSFTRTITILMWIQVTAVVLLVIVFGVLTYQQAEREMNSVATNFLNVYATQMENRMSRMYQNLNAVLSSSADLQLLKSDKEEDRLYASQRLRDTMQNLLSIDESAEIIVVAEAEQDVILDAYENNMDLDNRNAVRQLVMDYAQKGEAVKNWNFYMIEDTPYLGRTLVWNTRAVGVFISTETLLKTVPDIGVSHCGFILASKDGQVWGYAGYNHLNTNVGIRFQELPLDHMLINEITLEEGNIRLYSLEPKTEIFRQFQRGALVLLAAIVLLCIFDFTVFRIIRKGLVHPMNDMRKDMGQIQKGEYHLRIRETGEYQEFTMLAQAFNKLMDEIINLRIQYYERKLELSDAEQKYIRLQIRPHFFLNALTTIDSLSAKGRNQDIGKYIAALSKNIRYMFSSGLHTVPVKEEIRHVENYFEMQELKYPESVFYYIDLPQELENWPVPQMLIHTLIENEYKYAVSVENSLMVLIKISTLTLEGEEMLLIEVEDDGKGYPQEVLEFINGDAVRKDEENRVGLWSIKRLLELMYEQKHLFQIDNVEPHGAMNRLMIPKQPVHERNKDYLKETGIQ